MKPWKPKLALVAILATFGALLSAPAAHAAPTHAYSVAYDTNANNYTGLTVVRPDRGVANQPATGCFSYYTGDPVYQSQWVGIDNAGLNWIELGTGHQCDDHMRYWYWGWGGGGNWHPRNERDDPANGETHTFRIARAGGDTWTWRIDGTARGSMTWAVAAEYVSTGLETYENAVNVTAYNSYDLEYTTGAGAWTNWAGQDTQTVSHPGFMCGNWNNATSWAASENKPC